MIAFNVVLMAVIVVVIAAVLAWAIVSDRRSKRTSGGAVPPADASINDNLVMPREMLRARRFSFNRSAARRRHSSAT